MQTSLFSTAIAALLAVTTQDIQPNSQDNLSIFISQLFLSALPS
jgi:hypothetical protein